MPQSYSGLYYHIIFRTKNRFTLIQDNTFTRLGEYIGGIITSEGGKLLAYGGMPDHLHLLISLGREHTIADIVKKIKASSSKWIHDTVPEMRSFSWQAGYGAFTVSPSIIGNTKKYIATQREHHRIRTYREELIMFLKEYGVEYDEKWLPNEDVA